MRLRRPTQTPAPLPILALAAVLALPLAGTAATAATRVAGAATAASPAWRQQFDDPVLTALLAAVAPQDDERAQALARQWVAVRVFHAQWSTLDALARLAQDTQSALMDLPPGTEDREAQLARVASQIEQMRRLGADRAGRRDQAMAAVARLAGVTAQVLVARIGPPLTEWRLPHLVAEPPTVRLTVSPGTSALAQRLAGLHARHEAALQADRAVLAARQRLAQARPGAAAAPAADVSGTASVADPQPADLATAQAWQDLLLALDAQAGAAGDLALAWLDYLAAAPALGNSPSPLGHKGTARPA